jgi:hypothetical protein
MLLRMMSIFNGVGGNRIEVMLLENGFETRSTVGLPCSSIEATVARNVM